MYEFFLFFMNTAKNEQKNSFFWLKMRYVWQNMKKKCIRLTKKWGTAQNLILHTNKLESLDFALLW